MKQPNIIIVVEGGIVQGVLADRHCVVRLIDYDVEGVDRPLCEIPQSNGDETCEAYVRDFMAERNPKRVRQLAKVIDAHLDKEQAPA